MAQKILKDLLPMFIQDLENKNRSPSTIMAYRIDVEQLMDFLQKKDKVTASQITQSDIEAFRDLLLNQKYTAKSVSRKLNAIKTFFRWLLSEKHLNSNPTVEVAHPKINLSIPKFLSPLEYRALRDVVRDDNRIAAMIELILQTGLRISEVANLKLVNVKTNHILIESYASQPQRKIPLNKAAKESFSEYLKTRPKTKSPYVFVSKNGKPLAVRNIRAAIDRYMQRAEIDKYSVNDLRTTFMVENIKSGIDVAFLSQIAGHKRLSTTNRYVELAGQKEEGKRTSVTEL